MLQLAPGCIGLIAPDCRSWGYPISGNFVENNHNVLGLNGRDFVHCGNLMASRKLVVHAACMNSSMFQYQSRIHAFMHVLTKGLFDMLTYPQPNTRFLWWSSLGKASSTVTIVGNGSKSGFAG